MDDKEVRLEGVLHEIALPIEEQAILGILGDYVTGRKVPVSGLVRQGEAAGLARRDGFQELAGRLRFPEYVGGEQGGDAYT